MMCRTCEEQPDLRTAEEDRRSPDPSRQPTVSRRRKRVPEQLCTRCGKLLGADDTSTKVRKKQKQLAKFGLAGPRRPILKRPNKRDDR